VHAERPVALRKLLLVAAQVRPAIRQHVGDEGQYALRVKGIAARNRLIAQRWAARLLAHLDGTPEGALIDAEDLRLRGYSRPCPQRIGLDPFVLLHEAASVGRRQEQFVEPSRFGRTVLDGDAAQHRLELLLGLKAGLRRQFAELVVLSAGFGRNFRKAIRQRGQQPYQSPQASSYFVGDRALQVAFDGHIRSVEEVRVDVYTKDTLRESPARADGLEEGHLVALGGKPPHLADLRLRKRVHAAAPRQPQRQVAAKEPEQLTSTSQILRFRYHVPDNTSQIGRLRYRLDWCSFFRSVFCVR